MCIRDSGGFSLAELSSACVLAHAHGARVYVTLNVYVRDDELGDAVALSLIHISTCMGCLLPTTAPP